MNSKVCDVCGCVRVCTLRAFWQYAERCRGADEMPGKSLPFFSNKAGLLEFSAWGPFWYVEGYFNWQMFNFFSLPRLGVYITIPTQPLSA